MAYVSDTDPALCLFPKEMEVFAKVKIPNTTHVMSILANYPQNTFGPNGQNVPKFAGEEYVSDTLCVEM